jgi:hypothetical protein
MSLKETGALTLHGAKSIKFQHQVLLKSQRVEITQKANMIFSLVFL